MHSHLLLDALQANTAAHLARLIDSAQGAAQHSLPWPDTLAGYRFVGEREAMRNFLGSKSPWAVRAFLCCFEGTRSMSGQRLLDAECDWLRAELAITPGSHERAIDELIELIQGLDALLIVQSMADVASFSVDPLDAYRERHIRAGFRRREFTLLLHALLSASQRARLETELVPILQPRSLSCNSHRPSKPLSHSSPSASPFRPPSLPPSSTGGW